MSTLEISQLFGNYGEFVGAMGVVATLVYLALQIRSNTLATRSASRLDVARDYRQINNAYFDLPTANAFHEGLHNYPDVNRDQQNLFSTAIVNECLFFRRPR